MGIKHIISLGSLLAMAAGCSSTAVPGVPADADAPKAVCSIPANEAAIVEEVLQLVNEARAEEDLPPVKRSESLEVVADRYACEMIKEGFFAHENPRRQRSAGERLTAAGYIYYAMGENLAVGQTTPTAVIDDWLASPDHRANILSPDWSEAGISVRKGGEYGWYWVQEFADPVDLGD